MKKTHDTKKKWTGWLDKEILSVVEKMAAKKGIPVNYMVEELLRKGIGK